MKGKMRIVVDSSYGLRTAGRQLMDAPKSDWVVMSKVCPVSFGQIFRNP